MGVQAERGGTGAQEDPARRLAGSYATKLQGVKTVGSLSLHGRIPKPRSGDRFIARGETAGYASDCPENPGRGDTCMSNTTLASTMPGLARASSRPAKKSMVSSTNGAKQWDPSCGPLMPYQWCEWATRCGGHRDRFVAWADHPPARACSERYESPPILHRGDVHQAKKTTYCRKSICPT